MAGTNDLQLQLFDGTNTLTFTVDGRVSVHQQYEYNENTQPPELRQIVERWTVRDGLIAAADQATLWDTLQAALLHTEDRKTTPLTLARLVRAPSTANVTERTLGSTGWEGFRLESFEMGGQPILELQPSEWRTTLPVTLTLVAVRPFDDANGIVAWEQTIRNTYGKDGLHVLEWETSLSIKDADSATTTALDQAQAFATIPISNYGNTYVWDTNSPLGFDWEEADPDTRYNTVTEENTEEYWRVPTKVRIVSRIRQKGITVGSPSAGNSVGDVERTYIEEGTANQVRSIVEASAEGPGAFAWVKAQKPSGPIKEYVTRDERAGRKAFGRWVQETTDPTNNTSTRSEIMVLLQSGGEDFELVPVPGFPPQYVPGAQAAFRADVTVRIERHGVQPDLDEMKLPPVLGAPWRLAPNFSREDAVPRLQAPGVDQGADTWVREAHVVYFAASGASQDDFDALLDPEAERVVSYLL